MSLTSSMELDILSYDQGTDMSLLNTFPVLDKIPHIRNYVTADRRRARELDIIYMVLLYSPDSILNTRPMAELEERKMKAADLAGIVRKQTGEHTDRTKNRVFIPSTDFADVIFEYLISCNNAIWKEIVVDEIMYEQYQRRIIEPMPIKGEDTAKAQIDTLKVKTALRNTTKAMRDDLKGLYREFYADHDDIKAHVVKHRLSLEARAR